MLILKCQNRMNTKLYILDIGYKYYFIKFRKELINIFKIKKLICFSLVENEANSQVLSEIMKKFTNFESEKASLVYDEKNIIKEYTLEK